MKKFLAVFLSLLTIITSNGLVAAKVIISNNLNNIEIFYLKDNEKVIYIPHDQIVPFLSLLDQETRAAAQGLDSNVGMAAGCAAGLLLATGLDVALGYGVKRSMDKTPGISSSQAKAVATGAALIAGMMFVPPLAVAGAQAGNGLHEFLRGYRGSLPSSVDICSVPGDDLAQAQRQWSSCLLSDLTSTLRTGNNAQLSRVLYTDLGGGIIITIGAGFYHDRRGTSIFRAPTTQGPTREAPGLQPEVEGDRALATCNLAFDPAANTLTCGGLGDPYCTIKTIDKRCCEATIEDAVNALYLKN